MDAVYGLAEIISRETHDAEMLGFIKLIARHGIGLGFRMVAEAIIAKAEGR